MKEPGPDAATMLAQARAGLSPSAADQDRVRASLFAAIAAPPISQAGAMAASRASTWLSGLALVSVIAGAGTTGYWLGHRAAVGEAAQAIARATPPAAPTLIQRREEPAVEPRVEVAAAPRAPQPAAAKPAAHERKLNAAESLDKEVTALRGIEHALREEQPGLALALLRELERAVPHGKLVEERDACSAIAHCESNTVPFGVDLAEDFAEHHPDSVYLKRVQQACRETK